MNWSVVLLEPAKNMLSQIGQFLVSLLLVLIILLIGWLLSGLIKTLVTKGLRAAKLDVLSDKIELDAVLAKGGIKYSLSELIGIVCYWLGLLITFVVAIDAIGLKTVALLLDRIVLFVPNIVAAIFILVLAMFLATLLKNIVQTAANNAGISQSKILGDAVQVIIVVFAIAVALEQLSIAPKIIELTLSILLGSLGLGAALAFGLGCKDIAGKFIQSLVEKLKK